MRIRAALPLILVFASSCGLEGRPGPSTTPSRSRVSVASTPAPAPKTVRTPAPSPRPPSAGSRAIDRTPSAPPGCRNATEPSCGPLRFDPAVDDDPVRITVSFAPRSPKAGDTVTFSVRATDADSSDVELGTYGFGPRGSAEVQRAQERSCARGYGPWDPPAAEAGSAASTLRYTYREAGTYEATFIFTSRSSGRSLPGDEEGDCVDPYAGSGKADVTIVVR